MKKHKLCIFALGGGVLILFITSLFLYTITNPIHRINPDLSNNNYFVAHATGSLDGYTYLNSKESLLKSLKNGYKYIEVDLQLTVDSILVCVHDWEQFNKMTIPNLCRKDTNIYRKIPPYKEFYSRKIYGKFSPLSFSDLLIFQEQLPFIIITDKISNPEILNRFIPPQRRSRIMVEAFSKNDYYKLKNHGYTPMFSLGCVNFFHGGIQFIISQIFNHEIEWITAEQHSSKRTLRLLKKLFNLNIALYTVNSAYYFNWHLVNDVNLIYTDNWNLKTQLNDYEDNTTQ